MSQGNHARKTRDSKTFKEHLFEFLMLFLAVFFGFIAENIRENLVERSREKDYVHSLIKDLQTDDKSLHQVISDNNELVNNYDSLLAEIKKPVLNINRLYYYFIPSNSYSNFVADKSTIQQLENSGNLRLFKDISVSDSIAAYYNSVQHAEDQSQTFLGILMLTMLLRDKFFLTAKLILCFSIAKKF